MINNVYMKVSRGKKNQIVIDLIKHTGNLFEYEYIEMHNTVDGAKKYKVEDMARITKLPSEIVTTWMNKWYKINNYKIGFFTRLAEYFKNSNNPYENFIDEVENNINNSQNWTMKVEIVQ